MVLLLEEDDHYHEDKRSNTAEGADTCWNLKRHVLLVSLYLWWSLVAMCCITYTASSLSNVVKQIGRQEKILVQTTFFFKFGIWQLVAI